MPRKGLPRCECGTSDWLPMKIRENSAKMICQNCGASTNTRSVRGIARLRKLADIMQSIPQFTVTKTGRLYEVKRKDQKKCRVSHSRRLS